MTDLTVIIVNENCSYVNQFDQFYKDFKEINHENLTVLLIFESQRKFQKVLCSSIETIDEFPKFNSFINGFNEEEIEIWVQDALNFREMSGLPVEKVTYFYEKQDEQPKDITYGKKLKFNVSKQCTENSQNVGKDILIRIPLSIILKFKNFDGYRLFSVSNDHYSYGTRDFIKYKLEGFWKNFKPYGYMKRITQDETLIEYYDEDGNFVKKFTKNELPKIIQFISKRTMNYFNCYGIEDYMTLAYAEYEKKDGNVYRGTFKLGKNIEQGFGVAHYPSGSQLYGKFQEGVLSIGVLLYSDGTLLRGTFKDNCLQGKGMIQWTNGDIYEGDFIDGVRTGKGIIKWANGDIYEGDFLNDKRTGKGIIKWANGDIYEGDFIDGVRTGKGIIKWANGDIYEGDFLNNKRTGDGKMKRHNSEI